MSESPEWRNVESTPWPIISLNDSPAVAFTASDVAKAHGLLVEIERSLLASLDFIRLGEGKKAAGAIQIARSRLARWGGELAVLKERLEP